MIAHTTLYWNNNLPGQSKQQNNAIFCLNKRAISQWQHLLWKLKCYITLHISLHLSSWEVIIRDKSSMCWCIKCLTMQKWDKSFFKKQTHYVTAPELTDNKSVFILFEFDTYSQSSHVGEYFHWVSCHLDENWIFAELLKL